MWVFWGLLWVLWFLSGVKGWAVVPGGCVACNGFPGGFLPCFGRFARSEKITDEKIKIVRKKLTIFNIFFVKMLAFYGVIWYNIDS